MPMLFARYRVGELSEWKAAFDANRPNRDAHGLKVQAVYRDATYIDGVIVVYEAQDLERAHDFYHSDEQRERMARSGLRRAPEFWMASDIVEIAGADKLDL